MQFQVPQFIETEDRIVGPFTFRQFAVVAVFGVVIVFLFFVLSFGVWIFIAGVLGAMGVGLALGKINGRPIIVYAGALYESIWKPRVYVFNPNIPKEDDVLTRARKITALQKEAPRRGRRAASKARSPKKRQQDRQGDGAVAAPAVEPSEPNTKTALKEIQQQKHGAPTLGGLQGLREWIATSRTAIPKREKPLPRDFGSAKKRFNDRYEVVRYLTGEQELAKRVDYR